MQGSEKKDVIVSHEYEKTASKRARYLNILLSIPMVGPLIGWLAGASPMAGQSTGPS